MQIRARLTLQYIATVAAILLAAMLLVYFRYARLMEDEFFKSLHSKAVMTAEMVLLQEDKLKPEEDASSVAGERLPVSEVVSIYNREKKRIFAINPPATPLPDPAYRSIVEHGERRFRFADKPAIGLYHTSRAGNPYVVIAASNFENPHLEELRNILILSFFSLIGLVAIAGWFFAGRALQPVDLVVKEVDALLPSHLGVRLTSPESRDEIGRLVATFNRMLDRLYFAFQMQKRFISNVSHELRNPISVIISQLEVALEDDKAQKEDYRETLQSVLEDGRSMALMTERLLQMARVYSEDANISFSAIRLDELILQAQEFVVRAHPDYRLEFDLIGPIDREERLTINANEALLRLALSNLMENACKFSPDRRAEIRLALSEHKGPVVEIEDRGPGIPAEDISLIFQPFYRGAQQGKKPGSGIGLSLVDSILRLHQTEITIDSEVGRGTVFRLTFKALEEI